MSASAMKLIVASKRLDFSNGLLKSGSCWCSWGPDLMPELGAVVGMVDTLLFMYRSPFMVVFVPETALSMW